MVIGSLPIGPEGRHHAGRQLLRQMFLAHYGCEPPAIAIAPQGKPYFPGSSVHFSISHTRDRVFCVLAPHPVGIDAERQDRAIDLRLAQKILSPTELLRYEAAADKREALLRLWVLKEAAVKCTGQGLQGYPRHTDFSPEDHRITILDGCLVAVIEKQEANHAL